MAFLLVGLAMVAQVAVLTVFDFDDLDSVRAWTITNDDVMGGISQSDWYQEDDYVVFEGDVSLENNGGFASVRVWFRPVNLSEYDGIVLQVRGDGHTYAFGLRDMTSRYDYRVRFETTDFYAIDEDDVNDDEVEEWETIYIPFDNTLATFFGNEFPSVGQVNSEGVRGMNIIISDGYEGEFRLEIRSIGLYVEEEFNES